MEEKNNSDSYNVVPDEQAQSVLQLLNNTNTVSSSESSTQPESVQPESAQPESAQPESAQPESAQSESVQPESAQTKIVIDNTALNNKNEKTVTHGAWTFEINNKMNIYTTEYNDDDDNMRFNHVRNQQTRITLNDDDDDTKTDDTEVERLEEQDLENFRKAAMIHKVARKKALSMLYTGGKLSSLVDAVELIILKLCKQNPDLYYMNGGDSGIAFPVGVNINNVVAHDSKTIALADDRKFCEGDVVKVDIGVHIEGRIIDSAFTHIVTNKPGVHDTENINNAVLEASRDSVFATIKMAGPDQRLDELSETISEIISSYEVDLAGEVLPVRPIIGIGGHNIKRYIIHGGKLLLSAPDYDLQGDQRMLDGEVYAVETYASTGHGIVTQNSAMDRVTHFMETDESTINSNDKITKKDKKGFRQLPFYDWMRTRRGLPFSSSWIDCKKIQKVDKAFRAGISSGQMMSYPPLFDEENSVVAQFEHTIHVKNGSVEIFTIGDDY